MEDRSTQDHGLAESAARRFVEFYNQGSADWVDTIHAEDFVWIELPVHGVYPGKTGGREDLRKLSQYTVERFPGRRMELLGVLANGNSAAFQTEWTGTPVTSSDDVEAGQTMKLRAATFIEVNDEGKVTRQLDYTIRIA